MFVKHTTRERKRGSFNRVWSVSSIDAGFFVKGNFALQLGIQRSGSVDWCRWPRKDDIWDASFSEPLYKSIQRTSVTVTSVTVTQSRTVTITYSDSFSSQKGPSCTENANPQECHITIETAYKVYICPRGNLLNIRIYLITDLKLL